MHLERLSHRLRSFRKDKEGVALVGAGQERDGLLADGRFLVPAYLGTRGWLAYDLSGRLGGPVDWSEVHELIDSSYRATAGKRLIAQLDAR